MRSEHNSISEVPTPELLGFYVSAPDPLGVKRYLRAACFKILHAQISHLENLPGADIIIPKRGTSIVIFIEH